MNNVDNQLGSRTNVQNQRTAGNARPVANEFDLQAQGRALQRNNHIQQLQSNINQPTPFNSFVKAAFPEVEGLANTLIHNLDSESLRFLATPSIHPEQSQQQAPIHTIIPMENYRQWFLGAQAININNIQVLQSALIKAINEIGIFIQSISQTLGVTLTLPPLNCINNSIIFEFEKNTVVALDAIGDTTKNNRNINPNFEVLQLNILEFLFQIGSQAIQAGLAGVAEAAWLNYHRVNPSSNMLHLNYEPITRLKTAIRLISDSNLGLFIFGMEDIRQQEGELENITNHITENSPSLLKIIVKAFCKRHEWQTTLSTINPAISLEGINKLGILMMGKNL